MIMMHNKMTRSPFLKGIRFYSPLTVKMKVGWKAMLRELNKKGCFP